MILTGTSAWIEQDQATGSRIDARVTALIREDGRLLVTQPLIMEGIAGDRSEPHEEQLRRLLLRGGLLPFDAANDFEAASMIYRRCRQAGVAPHG